MKLNRNRTDGFTIIELLITMSIAVIVLTIGVPSFQNMVKDRRSQTSLQALITDLEMARSEAMTRNQSVVLCRHDGETATPKACSTSTDWEDGWVIFVDTDGDDKVDADELLRVTPSLGSSLSLDYSKASIAFSSRGFAGEWSGSFRICDDRGYQYGHKLVVSSSGFSQTLSATSCPS